MCVHLCTYVRPTAGDGKNHNAVSTKARPVRGRVLILCPPRSFFFFPRFVRTI